MACRYAVLNKNRIFARNKFFKRIALCHLLLIRLLMDGLNLRRRIVDPAITEVLPRTVDHLD